MSKMWTQATQGSASAYRLGRILKIIIIGGCFIVANSRFTELKRAAHTQSEWFLWGWFCSWKSGKTQIISFLMLDFYSLSSGVLPTEMSIKPYRWAQQWKYEQQKGLLLLHCWGHQCEPQDGVPVTSRAGALLQVGDWIKCTFPHVPGSQSVVWTSGESSKLEKNQGVGVVHVSYLEQ